ncbi:MAG: cyclic nucleotide-binding domain-containing protein [Myxococcota bacterium]|nr:cyclic nucleotide-binding domain-containing protein [Myxococcota bacterium]
MPVQLPIRDHDFLIVDIFRSLSGEHVKQAASALRCLQYEDAEAIFVEGTQNSSLIGILSGRVQITKETEEGRRVTLAMLRAGMTTGEMALIDGGRRSASAYAVGTTVVVELSQEALGRLSHGHPTVTILIQEALLRSLSMRLRRTSALFVDGAGS